MGRFWKLDVFYIVELMESLALPESLSATANPKAQPAGWMFLPA